MSIALEAHWSKSMEAGFQVFLYLTFCSLAFQVLLTLSTLKNKQKASLEEGKYTFLDYVMVVQECGRQPTIILTGFSHGHTTSYLAFRFWILYCSVGSH